MLYIYTIQYVVHSQQALESTCGTRLNKTLVNQSGRKSGRRDLLLKKINLKRKFKRKKQRNLDKFLLKLGIFLFEIQFKFRACCSSIQAVQFKVPHIPLLTLLYTKPAEK